MSERHTTEICELEAEIQRLTAALENRDAQIEDMDAGLGTEALRAEVEKLRAALAGLEIERNQWEKDCVEMHGALAEAEKRNAIETSWRAECYRKDAQIATLTQERAMLRQALMGIGAITGGKFAKDVSSAFLSYVLEEITLHVKNLTQERDAAKYYAEINADPIARADAENSKVAGLMTRWHEEIVRRERAEEAQAETLSVILEYHGVLPADWMENTEILQATIRAARESK